VTACETSSAEACQPDELQSNGYESLLALAQAFGERFFAARAGVEASGTEKCAIVVVSNQVEQVTGEEPLSPAKALVLGGCRVIPQEYPHLSCRHVDVAATGFTPEQLKRTAGLVVEEALRESAESRIALRGTSRWSLNFRRQMLAAVADESLPLRDGGVYLVTGGLGAVGLELAAEVVRRRRNVKLALVGREAPAAKGERVAR
jgi:acyl transferase domain-containing protein